MKSNPTVPPASSADAVSFYSNIAPEFHESYRTDPNRIERIAVWRRCISRHISRGRLAYDLGCGSGMLTCEIAPFAERVIAVDGSAAMLDIARRSAAERQCGNVEFRQSRLPPENGSWPEDADSVISSSVIEYLDSVEAALQFVKRILKPGGILIFSISNRDSLKRNAVRLFHRLTGRPKYFGFVRHMLSENDIRDVLDRAGFDLRESEYFDGSDRVNRALQRFVSKRRAANMILAVARLRR